MIEAFKVAASLGLVQGQPSPRHPPITPAKLSNCLLVAAQRAHLSPEVQSWLRETLASLCGGEADAMLEPATFRR